MNLVRFKTILFERELLQFKLAALLGWNPSKLSAIVRSHSAASYTDASALCRQLGVGLEELFPELAADGNKSNNGKSKNQIRRRRVRRENFVGAGV